MHPSPSICCIETANQTHVSISASHSPELALQSSSGPLPPLQTWVKQQSRIFGKSLAAYYKSWGWPVSAQTEADLSDLPSWSVPASQPPSPPSPGPGPAPPPPPPAPPVAPSPNMSATDYRAIVKDVGLVPCQPVWSSYHYLFDDAMAIAVDGQGRSFIAANTYGAWAVGVAGWVALCHQWLLPPHAALCTVRAFLLA